jgi:hypothetical protein
MKNSYKFITQILIFWILLIQFGCSWIGIREPAAKKMADVVTADDVFSFPASSELIKKDFKEAFVAQLGFASPSGIKFEAELSSDLPEGIAFKLETEVTDQFYIYKILHSKNAFKDPAAAFELGSLLGQIAQSQNPLAHHLSIFEMIYNAKEGDPVAMDNFLKIRQLQNYYHNPTYIDAAPDMTERKSAIEALREKIKPQIKELKDERKVLEASRKALMDKLDKAPDAKQFRTLVAKGDREGVADLLKKYLPWEDMAPFEKRFWETHLEVLRKPVPLDQRVLIYRGLNDDFIHSAYEAGKEVSKEDALRDGKAFVMSSVLVKNQGSWNRRLRSLEAMNEKFIGTINNTSEFSQSARISTMFYKHAADPKGSPFLSLTPDINIAKAFGQKQTMAALVDPRMIHFNYVSGFKNEVEFLMPLVTFPEDMAGLWTQKYNSEVDIREFFAAQLKQKITDEFGKGKADEIIKRIKKNSADYFKTVFENGDPKITKVSGGTMADFYKKFSKAKGIKAPMTVKGDLDCKNLIKIFWTAP